MFDIDYSTLIDWRGFKVFSNNVPEKRPGGYSIWNLVNGKPYFGITGTKKGVADRGKSHAESSANDELKTKFARSLRKYGLSSFLFVPIFYLSEEVVDKIWFQTIEAEWIRENDAIRNGYNVVAASGGVGPYGEEFGNIVKEAMADPGIRERQLAGILAAWADPEKKKNRLEWMKDPEAYKRWQAALYKTNSDPLKIERLIFPLRALFKDPDFIARRSAAHSATCKQNPKMCITDGTKTIKIPVSSEIPAGWRKGQAVKPIPPTWTPERRNAQKERMRLWWQQRKANSSPPPE